MNDDKTILAEGKHLRFLRVGSWEYVERKVPGGAAVIVPVTHDGRLVLTEQFRPPLGKNVIEFPAGLVGDIQGQEDESAATAAQRELLEETGYQAESMEYLAGGPTSAGLSSETVAFFLARGARKVAAGGGDGTESIAVHLVPIDEIDAWLREMADRGAAVAMMVYAGLHLLRASKRKPHA